MAQMLPMVVNKRPNDWDIHLTHVKFAYNNSLCAATGCPREVYMDRLPRLLLTIFEHHCTPGTTKAPPSITWNTPPSPPTASGGRMSWYVNNTLSWSLAWSVVTRRSQTPSNISLPTPSVAGYGFTTPPIFAKVPNLAQTRRFLRRSCRSTGPVLSKYYLSAPRPSTARRTAALRPLIALLGSP